MRIAGGTFLRRMPCGALLALATAGCTRESVRWSDVRYSLAGTAGAAIGVKDSTEAGDAAELLLPLPDSAACRKSIRLARAEKSFFAAWWSIRRDSSAVLLTSRSDDGGPWMHPVVADSSDASRRGCDRPAPSIAADFVSGYVHLAYFIEPSTGAGIFAIHSMDRDSTFHSRVAMVYGSRPSNTAIAAEGEKVVVAYEDPNSTRHQIFVALSHSMGHLFEDRLPVSEENADATEPVVKIRGTKLEVSWIEPSSAGPSSQRHASRTGIWK